MGNNTIQLGIYLQHHRKKQLNFPKNEFTHKYHKIFLFFESLHNKSWFLGQRSYRLYDPRTVKLLLIKVDILIIRTISFKWSGVKFWNTPCLHYHPPTHTHKVMLWDFCPYFGEFMVFPLTWSGGVNMGVFQRTTPGSMTIYLEWSEFSRHCTIPGTVNSDENKKKMKQ